jgi:hypothetical protein
MLVALDLDANPSIEQRNPYIVALDVESAGTSWAVAKAEATAERMSRSQQVSGDSAQWCMASRFP